PAKPIKCPPGSQMMQNHGGTYCAKDAPKDCPAGWLGQLGGTCALELCAEDPGCNPGKTCTAVDLCSYDKEAWIGSDDPSRSARSPLLAGPPSRQRARYFIDACGRGRACEAPSSCRSGRVCLPPGVAAPAPRPNNANAYQWVDSFGPGSSTPGG